MKKWMRIAALVLCAVLLLAGCGNKKGEVENETKPTSTRPLYRTEDEILTAAANYWGFYPGDRHEETGNPLSMMVLDTPTADNPTYRILLRYLVENEDGTSHYTTVDTILLDAKTGQVLTETDEG